MTLESNLLSLATRVMFSIAFVSVLATPAHAMSRESKTRLTEMQVEVSAELKSLKAQFAKRMNDHRQEPIVTPEDQPSLETAAISVAAATESH